MILGLVIFVICLSASIAWLWAGGIDYMMKNHPDYKGEDFLNWEADENDKDNIY